jgi:hypothetical protein
MTHEMITQSLKDRGFEFKIDEDGDILGNFEGNLIYFFRLGPEHEMLQVRTMSQHVFGMEDVNRLYEFSNSWNHDRLWPKAYVHVADDGVVSVIGELVADWEKGVTQEQLDQVLICGIATGCQLSAAAGELKQNQATT